MIIRTDESNIAKIGKFDKDHCPYLLNIEDMFEGDMWHASWVHYLLQIFYMLYHI